MNGIIRQEQPHDYFLTEQVVKKAFESAAHTDGNEHQLVAKLRNSHHFIPELSLVAISQEEVIGHVLLTKIHIVKENGDRVPSLALAPVSVLPPFQNKGIGKQLITVALEKAKELGYGSVIVLGHPKYYPKFGFQKASLWGIRPPFQVADDVFMALELRKMPLAMLPEWWNTTRRFSNSK